jgi:16S rRNA G966 N2-methylase RsmD
MTELLQMKTSESKKVKNILDQNNLIAMLKNLTSQKETNKNVLWENFQPKNINFKLLKKKIKLIGEIKENKNYSQKFINQIITGDSEEILKKIPNSSVDLVFTSPPYNFGMEQADLGKKIN